MSSHEAEIAALVEFVERRLDEAELYARLSGISIWRHGGEVEHDGVDPGTVVAMDFEGRPFAVVAETFYGYASAEHIAHHSPYRTVREVAAGRQLIARWHKEIRRRDTNAELLSALVSLPQEKPVDHTMIEQTRAEGWMIRGRIWALTYALMLEGRKYEDHPDWRPRWCPERLFPPAYTCPCHPPLTDED